MKKEIHFFTFATINTTSFLPYLLYLLIGNSYPTALNGWLPVLIFYVSRLTATFFFNTFGKRYTSRKLLEYFLMLAAFGSLLGVFTFISPIFLELSALIFGSACSILAPLFTTVQYHERMFLNHKLSAKDSLYALLSILAVSGLLILSVKDLAPEVGFLLFAVAFAFCTLNIKQLPEYNNEVPLNPDFNLRMFVLFALLTALIYSLKYLRLLTSPSILVYITVILFLLAVTILLLIRRKQISFGLSWYVYSFSYLQGLVKSFALLYTLFYLHSRAEGRALYGEIYVAFGIGMILSMGFGNLLVNKVTFLKPLTTCGIMMILGAFLILFPQLIFVGTFLIGFFSNVSSGIVSRAAYAESSPQNDNAILTKNRWIKFGSISQQTLLVLLIAGISSFSHLNLNNIVGVLSGHSILIGTDIYQNTIHLVGMILFAIISLALIGNLFFYEKIKD